MQTVECQNRPLTRLCALTSAVLLIAMMSISVATGVSQEPFEVVRDPGAYRSELVDKSFWLKVVLATDSLFIIAYTCFFLCFARVAGQHGDTGMLRIGVIFILVTAILDIIEDQHLFALADSVQFGEAISLGTLRMQHVLSQAKFHFSYIGMVIFALGLPRRNTIELTFALAVSVPLAIVGVLRWIAPPFFQFPFVLAQWIGFLSGFIGAALIVDQYSNQA